MPRKTKAQKLASLDSQGHAVTTAATHKAESDEDELFQLEINDEFADKYNKKKQMEELSKLQDKYGKDISLKDLEQDDDSEESLSDDDSDAELVTPQVDAAILRTLAKIRNKDPTVYEQGRQVFDEEETDVGSKSTLTTTTKPTKPSKPILLRDYQRQRMLNAYASDEDDDDNDTISKPVTHWQEQQALKEEVKRAFMADDDDDDEQGDLLVQRDKSQDELQREEREYAQFLKQNAGGKAVKDALDAEDRFLREYILNRGWIDREANPSRIPSYKEITGGDASDEETSSRPNKNKTKRDDLLTDEPDQVLDPGLHDSEESEFEDKAEDFEYRYNFRFEDPEGTLMTTHARNAVSTVRKPTTTATARQRARESAKEREQQEKQARKEEIRRLKALKRKQVEQKLLQLIEVAGQGTKGLDQIDLEQDWDPEKHDEQMNKVYGQEYDDMDDDGFKPTWDDDIDISDLVDHEEQGHDDEDAAMSLPFTSAKDSVDELEDKEPSQQSSRKKRKRDEEGFPSTLMQQARVQASTSQDTQQMLDKLEDEYYGIEYEDKIGDLQTRFKYTKVEPNDFSLTPQEILLATDNELNEYMSLKKLAPYRSDSNVVKRNKKKLKELRDILKTREWGQEVTDEWTAGVSSRDHDKSAKSKKKKRSTTEDSERQEGEPVAKKKKRVGKSERKKRRAHQQQADEGQTGGDDVE
ncbi:Kinetochore protein Spc24 [Microbotryomycetes sp. JL221]|nr:Kinetochore protein Spc24 [Microbotryomycetes sp. JL221]